MFFRTGSSVTKAKSFWTIPFINGSNNNMLMPSSEAALKDRNAGIIK
jgi:hypothetical protein